MTSAVHPIVRERFVHLNITEVIEQWIQQICVVNSNDCTLFAVAESGDVLPQKNTFIGIPFNKGAITSLYTKLCLIQKVLLKEPLISHIGLLMHINPFLGRVYWNAFTSLSVPSERYQFISSSSDLPLLYQKKEHLRLCIKAVIPLDFVNKLGTISSRDQVTLQQAVDEYFASKHSSNTLTKGSEESVLQMQDVSFLVQHIWKDDEQGQKDIMGNLYDCRITSIPALCQAIRTPAASSFWATLPFSCFYNGYPPLLNQLIVQYSSKMVIKSNCLYDIMQYIVNNHLSTDPTYNNNTNKKIDTNLAASSDSLCNSPTLSNNIRNRIAVIGWDDMLHNFGTGDAKLLVEGEELQVQIPSGLILNVETAAFKYGGPELPLEFSRISMKGQLRCVIDFSIPNLNPQPTWYACHKSSDMKTVIANLKTFTYANKDEIVQLDLSQALPSTLSPLENMFKEWANTHNFTGVVCCVRQPNFKKKLGQPFSIEKAKAYLDLLKKDKQVAFTDALHYFISLPLTLTTPLLARIRGWCLQEVVNDY